MNAMEAAKAAREEQLATLEKFLSGEPTEFLNHQGKGMTFTYDPNDLTKTRSSAKV